MTIDEAIRLIQDDIDHNYYAEDSPLEKAVKLGIEALKRLKEHREDLIDITYRALPGETEE